MNEILLATKSDVDAVAEQLATHARNTGNPHGVTKEQIGLSQVANAPQVVNAGDAPEISANTFTRRPAAGKVGRIFIATDTLQVFRDTGDVWVEIARAPRQIGAGDLAFEPATQAELDALTKRVAALEAKLVAQDQ